VIVEDDQLSLAIGKKGQNVRLAAKLTKWRLDIKSRSEYEQGLRTTAEGALAGLTAAPVGEDAEEMADVPAPAEAERPEATEAPARERRGDATGNDGTHELQT
jgi:transcription termination/antitermination protein NusA